MQNRTSYFGFLQKLFFYGCFHNVAGIRSSLKKGIKKQFAPTENTSIKTNCSLISTNYIFLNLDDFTKISSLSGIKAREKNKFQLHLHSTGQFRSPAKPLFTGFFAFLSAIQTRKIKFSSIQFCIGNLALFDFIWFQLSYLYGLYLLVLSTCYQSTVITIAI